MQHPERIIPDDTEAGIVAIHLSRYAFAKPFCAGRRVLDAACGVGYGTAYLADGAESVLGVDLSDEALAYARARYASSNVSFAEMDVTRLDLADESFDAVCSFETIEHVDDPGKAIAEAARVLRKDGVYIVSTPHAKATTRTPANPFHLVELSRADLESTLRLHFLSVELYGQARVETTRHRILRRLDVLGLRRRISLGRTAGAVLGSQPTASLTLNDLVIARDAVERADDLVAVCRERR